MEVILKEDIARQLRKVGLEPQRPQSLRQAQARFAPLWRGGGAGRRAGV